MASSQNASKVSFTIRRPTPAEDADFKIPALPRHLTDEITPLGSPLASSPASPAPDSSDEEDEALQDELVSGFDKFGVQRLNEKKKAKQGPLVIPALKNRDWREQARKRRSASQFVPVSATAKTGADGSVGGLGTRDSINSGPTLSGLQVKQREVKLEQDEDQEMLVAEEEDIKMEEEPETEDQRALRAILAESNGEVQDGPTIDIIPISETDALKQDVEELPDSATMDDYARVPVSQFGAALLRGMGWKEGTAASRKPGKGLIEPYLPTARPALLGIGAKEQEVYDDGSKKKKGGGRPERRYVPVIKKEREGSGTPGSSSGRGGDRSRSPTRRTSAPVSRRSSRSPDTTEHNRDRDDRKRESGRRDRDYGRERERNRDRDRDYDYDSGRDRRDKDRDSTRHGERDRGYEKEKERDRDFDRDRRRGDDASRSDRHREQARDSDRKRRNY